MNGMGTRADFYVGRGVDAEWLGSIAMDGYPSGISKEVLTAKTQEDFRLAVHTQLSACNHATLPDMGWPWSWVDSHLTDFSYAFDKVVFLSSFGAPWLTVSEYNAESEDDAEYEEIKCPVCGNGHYKDTTFPDMTSKKKVGAGLIVMRVL